MPSAYCIVALFVTFESMVSGNGDPSCWSGGFTRDICCKPEFGPRGNTACWDGSYTFQRCCGVSSRESEPPPTPKPIEQTSWMQDVRDRHSVGPDGVPISMIPVEYGLAIFVIFAVVLALWQVNLSRPTGMLGNGDRQGNGPDGLAPEDTLIQRKRRVDRFAGKPAGPQRVQPKITRMRVN